MFKFISNKIIENKLIELHHLEDNCPNCKCKFIIKFEIENTLYKKIKDNEEIDKQISNSFWGAYGVARLSRDKIYRGCFKDIDSIVSLIAMLRGMLYYTENILEKMLIKKYGKENIENHRNSGTLLNMLNGTDSDINKTIILYSNI